MELYALIGAILLTAIIYFLSNLELKYKQKELDEANATIVDLMDELYKLKNQNETKGN